MSANVIQDNKTLPNWGRSRTDPEEYVRDNEKARRATKQQLVTLEELKAQNVEEKQRFYVNISRKISEIPMNDNDSHFPDIPSFNQQYTGFIFKTHRPICDALTTILKEIKENDDDDDDDIDLVTNINDIDIKAMKVQQIAYEILYNIMMECHTAMKQRKNRFYAIIGEILHIPNNDSFHGMLSMFLENHFQSRWDSFVANKYYNFPSSRNKEEDEEMKSSQENRIHFNHENIDDIIENIYDRIKAVKLESNTHDASYAYNVLFILCKQRKLIEANAVHCFIAQCCVLFWAMLLYKEPMLQLSHDTFWIKPWQQACIPIKHSIDVQPIDNSSSIQYCGAPGIVYKNNKSKVLVAPHIFMHDDPLVCHALSSTPS